MQGKSLKVVAYLLVGSLIPLLLLGDKNILLPRRGTMNVLKSLTVH